MGLRRLGLLYVALLANLPQCAVAAETDTAEGRCPPAASLPFAFWLGHWDVYSAGKFDGRNFIESTLDGCSAIEHWDDASGFRGLSIFYFEPHAGQWKQVWLTDHARRPGGTKEKILIHADHSSVRFQGTLWVAPDHAVLDRTTLRKLESGRVSQVIEHSADGGTTWVKSYDAEYRRATEPQANH